MEEIIIPTDCPLTANGKHLLRFCRVGDSDGPYDRPFKDRRLPERVCRICGRRFYVPESNQTITNNTSEEK